MTNQATSLSYAEAEALRASKKAERELKRLKANAKVYDATTWNGGH